MSCPDCGNFMILQALGGKCYSQCVSCKRNYVVPQLVVHTTRRGMVQQASDEGKSAQEHIMVLENLSYDETLYQLSDRLCPTCKSKTRVWLSETHLYIYLCPKCHKVVDPIKTD